MTSLKRKFLEGDEDPWEQEALRSSQPIQANELIQTTRILDAQYDELSKTYSQLERKLRDLRQSVAVLDRDVDEKRHSALNKGAEYDSILDGLAEFGHSVSRVALKNSLCENEQSFEAYLKADRHFLDLISQTLALYREHMPLQKGSSVGQYNHSQAKDEPWLQACHQSEMTVIKEELALCGTEAKVQSLERDLRKLNGLPQILPILQSTTGHHRQDAEKKQKQLKQMFRDIDSMIEKLGDINVRMPLSESQQEQDFQTWTELSNHMDEINAALLKQRACQQLVSFGYDVDKEAQWLLWKMLETLLDRLSATRRVCSAHWANETQEQEQPSKRHDNDVLSKIETLLALGRDGASGVSSDMDDTDRGQAIISKITSLKQYEEGWKKRWSENIESKLDGVRALGEIKDRIMDELDKDSANADHATINSIEYKELQDELKVKTEQLQDTIGDLEHAAKIDRVFSRRRRLFSLFYTNPEAFAEITHRYE